MAQRRMISKSISTSTKLAELDTFSNLLFTWLIPHCDDYGHMEGLAKIVKGIVVPLRDESVEDVEKSLTSLENADLIERYKVDGRIYIEIVNFGAHQTFKNDRPKHQGYPRKPVDSTRKPDDSFVQPSEVNRSEVKLREEKRGGAQSIKYLSNLPKEDIKEFLDRFNATEKEIKSKAEDLKLYCERKGREYKNYKSFLLNALKRDFKERDGTAKGGKYAHLT